MKRKSTKKATHKNAFVKKRTWRTVRAAPKGPGGTPKPDRKPKVDTGIPAQNERIEAINITLSVERLAGWMEKDIVKHLTEELGRVAELLGGDNGPRFNVAAGPKTIVELDPLHEPYWKTIDIEPIKR